MILLPADLLGLQCCSLCEKIKHGPVVRADNWCIGSVLLGGVNYSIILQKWGKAQTSSFFGWPIAMVASPRDMVVPFSSQRTALRLKWNILQTLEFVICMLKMLINFLLWSILVGMIANLKGHGSKNWKLPQEFLKKKQRGIFPENPSWVTFSLKLIISTFAVTFSSFEICGVVRKCNECHRPFHNIFHKGASLVEKHLATRKVALQDHKTLL